MSKDRILAIAALTLIAAGLLALLANPSVLHLSLFACGLLLLAVVAYFVRMGRKWRHLHPEKAADQQRLIDANSARIEAETNRNFRTYLMGVPLLAIVAIVADASKHGGRIWPQSPIGFVLAGLFILGTVVAPLLIVWKTRKQA